MSYQSVCISEGASRTAGAHRGPVHDLVSFSESPHVVNSGWASRAETPFLVVPANQCCVDRRRDGRRGTVEQRPTAAGSWTARNRGSAAAGEGRGHIPVRSVPDSVVGSVTACDQSEYLSEWQKRPADPS